MSSLAIAPAPLAVPNSLFEMFSRLRTLAHQLAPRIRTGKMSTVHNKNVACCSIPPVESDYTPKGTFKSYGGFNKVRRHRRTG